MIRVKKKKIEVNHK